MTAKCGTCYWNTNMPACSYTYMAENGDGCTDWRPAKLYEHGRPKCGRGGA
jgi:hypothetical protein